MGWRLVGTQYADVRVQEEMVIEEEAIKSWVVGVYDRYAPAGGTVTLSILVTTGKSDKEIPLQFEIDFDKPILNQGLTEIYTQPPETTVEYKIPLRVSWSVVPGEDIRGVVWLYSPSAKKPMIRESQEVVLEAAPPWPFSEIYKFLRKRRE